MGRTGHHLTGIAAGCLAACAFWSTAGVPSLVAIPAGYFGGTAPDWLEIAHAEYSTKYQKWMRQSVIPHRTITHWWPVWAALSALLVTWPFQSFQADTLIRIAGTGFVAGAWMHLLMDLPNPTGIPIVMPRAKSRFGLGWWKSGNALEPLAGVLMVAGAGALLFGVAHGSLLQESEMFPMSISTLFQSIP
ncbi:MAG: metal-dependent hydrolase [Acidithiobacillus sp.]